MTWLAIAWKWVLPALSAVLRCKPCLIALAVGVALLSSYWAGHHNAEMKCQEAQLAAKLANKQADLDNARKAAADATARANAIEVNASDQRKEDADYIARLKNRPACDLTDDDIRGLPNHRNRNGARSSAPAR